MEKVLCKVACLLYIFVLFNLDSLRMLTCVTASADSFKNPLNSKLPFSNKEYRRLKAKGLEMMPFPKDEITSNAIGEPSCEELRAMWRYDKRQHRAAELTNQIPNLPSLFWDIPQKHQPSSFGMFRAGSGVSFRPKGSRKYQDKVFGRVLLSPGKSTDRKKPLEELMTIMAKEKPSKPMKPELNEPILRINPPPEPTPETSFQKLKNLYREERMKDSGQRNGNHPAPPAALAGKEFGKLILSPPKGQDGRIANKPKELMSPFERLRFGQVDDLLGIKDEIEGKHVLGTNFPLQKRRYGFINFPLPHKNMRLASQTDGTLLIQSNGNKNNNNLAKNTVASQSNSAPVEREVTADQFQHYSSGNTNQSQSGGDSNTNTDSKERTSMLNSNSLNSFHGGEVQNIPRDSSHLERQLPSLMVEETPSCPEVEQQACSTNSDCTCVGYGLYRCFHGQCQVLSVAPEVLDDYDVNGGGGGVAAAASDDAIFNNNNNNNNRLGGINSDNTDGGGGFGGFWHSESIPNTHLGIWDSSPYIESVLSMADETKRKRKRSVVDLDSTK